MTDSPPLGSGEPGAPPEPEFEGRPKRKNHERGRDGGRERGEMLRTYGTYGAMGMEMAAAFVIPVLAGLWADRRWDTLPLLTLIGLVLGFITALRVVTRYLKLLSDDDASTPRRRGNASAHKPRDNDDGPAQD